MKSNHYDLLVELLQDEIARLKKQKFEYWQQLEKAKKENRKLQREIADFTTEKGDSVVEKDI